MRYQEEYFLLKYEHIYSNTIQRWVLFIGIIDLITWVKFLLFLEFFDPLKYQPYFLYLIKNDKKKHFYRLIK